MERRRSQHKDDDTVTPEPMAPPQLPPMPELDALSALVEHAKAHVFMMKSYLLTL